MKTITTRCGDRIEDTARALVAAHPSQCEFNGIKIRARYATTRPRDIVAKFIRDVDTRCVVWRHSPEGRKHAADSAREVAEAQRMVDACVIALPAIDLASPAAVLRWIENIAKPADRVGVIFDKAAIVARFDAAGWSVGANCHAAFAAEDARNVAGWIVGQWLDGYPYVKRHIDDWRAKFGAS